MRILAPAPLLVVITWLMPLALEIAHGQITFDYAARKDAPIPKADKVASLDGTALLDVQADKSVRLFSTKTGEPAGPAIELQKKGLAFIVTAIAIAPDNKTIATAIGNYGGDWGRVDVWDATTGKHLTRYMGPPYLGIVYALFIGKDGQTVFVSSGPAGGK